jgi:hypothetical protein
MANDDDIDLDTFTGNPFALSDEQFLEYQDRFPRRAASAIIKQAVDFHEGRYIDNPDDPRLKNPEKYGGVKEVLKARFSERFGPGKRPNFHNLQPTKRGY